jgi:hypothetical protein
MKTLIVLWLICLIGTILTSCASKPPPKPIYFCSHTATMPRVAAMGDSPEEAKDVMRSLSCELRAPSCAKRECNEKGVL